MDATDKEKTGPILVTGAAGGQQGGTGYLVVSLLRERGLHVRALVRRSDERAERLRAMGAEVVIGDLLDIGSVRVALQNVERAYFCYPVREGLLEATALFAQAGCEAGLKAVVNLSQGSAADTSPSPASRLHWLSERIFDWSGIGVVHLRGAVFYENLRLQTADSITAQGKMLLPFGEGNSVVPLVAGEDIARVSAAILASPEPHLGQTYNVTGPEALTMQDIARVFSAALHKPVAYVETPLEAWQDNLVQKVGSVSALQIEHLTKLWVLLKAANIQKGTNMGRVSDIVERVGGAPAKPLEVFVRENATAFGGIAAL